MRQWNHETRKEEKKEGEDIEKKAVLSLPLYPWTKEGTGGEDIGRAIKLTSDETQGTLLENGLRGEQILKSRGVSIKCYLQVSPKCSESRSDLPRVTGGDSVLTSS